MKKSIFFLVTLLLSVIGSIACYGEEYMVKLSKEAVIPFSLENQGYILGDSRVLEVSEEKAHSMLNNGTAEYIEKIQPVTLFDVEYNDTYYSTLKHFNVMNISALDLMPETQNSVKIGIIDSGIYQEHSDFENTQFEKGYNFVEDNDNTTDLYDHGTAVAGIIAATPNNQKGVTGIAPNSVLVPYVTVTLDSEGNVIGGSNALVKCIYKAVEDGCKILNISAGIEEESKLLEEAVQYAQSEGVIICSAVGNYGNSEKRNMYMYPAAYDNVIGVGAVYKSMSPTGYSQKNDKVNCVAIIDGLYGMKIDGGYKYLAGTSFTCPIITGILARTVSKYPDLSVDMAIKAVQAATMDINDVGRDYSGYGLLMADEMINYLSDNHSVFISPFNSDTFNLKIVAKDNVDKAVLVRGIYTDKTITQCKIEEISFEDNMYCIKSSVTLDENQELRMFLLESLENQRSMSLVKKYLQ